MLIATFQDEHLLFKKLVRDGENHLQTQLSEGHEFLPPFGVAGFSRTHAFLKWPRDYFFCAGVPLEEEFPRKEGCQFLGSSLVVELRFFLLLPRPKALWDL